MIKLWRGGVPIDKLQLRDPVEQLSWQLSYSSPIVHPPSIYVSILCPYFFFLTT